MAIAQLQKDGGKHTARAKVQSEMSLAPACEANLAEAMAVAEKNAVDLDVHCNAARKEGMDLPALLVGAGIKGIIDPARNIIAHKLTQWQYSPKKAGGKHRVCLSNDCLFELTTRVTMAAYTHEKLIPHRALDDAKAERIWL